MHFVSRLGVSPKTFLSRVCVSTLAGDSLVIDQVCRACMVTLQGFDTLANLILLDILDFNIILGMDWLARHHTGLDFYAKIVILVIPRMSPVIWQGSISWVPTGIVSYIRAWRLISKGCSAYLAIVRDSRDSYCRVGVHGL